MRAPDARQLRSGRPGQPAEFFFGESKTKFGADFLYVLLMHAVGQRALGEIESLDDIVAKDWTVDKYPAMFYFGLLEKFDIPHLKALEKN